MKLISRHIIRIRYRLAVFGLLTAATIFCVNILRMRASFTGSLQYAFLIWNLFLAWIPFIIAYFTYAAAISRRWLYFIIPISGILWLVFFPNAPYILTDLQHLSNSGNDIPVWYDVILLIWFAFTGLFLGMVSLFLMQEVVRREFGRWIGWGFVVSTTVLASIGVYMGRFLRWNSWDILDNFAGMAQFTMYYILNPTERSIIFAGLFVPLFLFVYLLLYTFGHLLLERRSDEDAGSAHA